MSNYERQIQATAKIYDEVIQAAEQEDIEILSSVVPGSRLHEIIHNPIDSGIDKGGDTECREASTSSLFISRNEYSNTNRGITNAHFNPGPYHLK